MRQLGNTYSSYSSGTETSSILVGENFTLKRMQLAENNVTAAAIRQINSEHNCLLSIIFVQA